MAFSCVLHLKEECDGCGMCEEPLGRAEAWSAETERWAGQAGGSKRGV